MISYSILQCYLRKLITSLKDIENSRMHRYIVLYNTTNTSIPPNLTILDFD
ncbi:hypothetical protein Hanom_Chr03g00205131 [Helianthus anomalus]